MQALSDLFPPGDFRFHLTLRRGTAAEFFRDRDATGAEREERVQWVERDAARHVALTPAGEPLLAELRELAAAWGLRAFQDVRELAAACEPDVVLLSREADDTFRLQGGALVFPSGWDLREKLGRRVGEIHAIVPGLNPALGVSIDRFLTRITPDAALQRWNWGLAAHAERNAHPARELPAPQPPVGLDRLWLRVEHQALLALPRTRGIVFGIRILLHRLDAAVREPGVAAGLGRTLATMPPAMRRYKRIEEVAGELAELLLTGRAITET